MVSIAACRTLIPALAQFLYAKGRAALDAGSAHLAFSSWDHSRLCLPPLRAPQPRILRSPEPTRPPSPHLSAIAPAVRVWRLTGPSEQKSAVQCGNRVLGASTAGPCGESPPDVLRYLLHGGWEVSIVRTFSTEGLYSDCSGSSVCTTPEPPSSRPRCSGSEQTH